MLVVRTGFFEDPSGYPIATGRQNRSANGQGMKVRLFYLYSFHTHERPIDIPFIVSYPTDAHR